MNLTVKYQREIITAINNNHDIVFILYSSFDNTEKTIKFTLAKILSRYNREDILTPVLTCIKELIANATKAINKKILMDEGIITQDTSLDEVLTSLKSILNKKSLLEYGIKSKDKKLSARLYLKVEKDYLIIEIINNIPLSENEQQRILKKIKQASLYDNIAEYYLENPDPEAEGMGLGISMIVIILKGINISYKNLTIGSNKIDKTFARIIVPLTDH